MNSQTSDLGYLSQCFAEFYGNDERSNNTYNDISLPIKKFLKYKGVQIVEPYCIKTNAGTKYVPYREYFVKMGDITATGVAESDQDAIYCTWSHYLSKLLASLHSNKNQMQEH